MKKRIWLMCLLAMTSSWGCTASRSTVQVQEPRAVVVAEYTPSIVEVRDAIFSGIHAAKWRAQDRAPGLIYATNKWRGEQVLLEVDYSATAYTIRYKDSTDEDYSEQSGNIPQDFPRWASFIAKNIEEKIAVIGIQAAVEIKAFPRIAPALPGEPTILESHEDIESFKRKKDSTRFDTNDKASVLVKNTDDASVEKNMEISEPKRAEPTQAEHKEIDSKQSEAAQAEAVQSGSAETAQAAPVQAEKAMQPSAEKTEATQPAVTHAVPVVLSTPQGQEASPVVPKAKSKVNYVPAAPVQPAQSSQSAQSTQSTQRVQPVQSKAVPASPAPSHTEASPAQASPAVVHATPVQLVVTESTTQPATSPPAQ